MTQRDPDMAAEAADVNESLVDRLKVLMASAGGNFAAVSDAGLQDIARILFASYAEASSVSSLAEPVVRIAPVR